MNWGGAVNSAVQLYRGVCSRVMFVMFSNVIYWRGYNRQWFWNDLKNVFFFFFFLLKGRWDTLWCVENRRQVNVISSNHEAGTDSCLYTVRWADRKRVVPVWIYSHLEPPKSWCRCIQGMDSSCSLLCTSELCTWHTAHLSQRKTHRMHDRFITANFSILLSVQ